MKFTSPDGQVAIRTFNDKDRRFHFEIADTGIGIEPQRLSTLFRPFEQADPSVTRHFGGLGLGLAISKRLVDLHHGTIEADVVAGASAPLSRWHSTLCPKEPTRLA